MLLASEAIRAFTAFEVIFAFAQAVALVGALIWIKLIMHRRREAEESAEALQPSALRSLEEEINNALHHAAHQEPGVRQSLRREQLQAPLAQGERTISAFRPRPIFRQPRPSTVLPERTFFPPKIESMKKRNIIITAPDHARLRDIVAFGYSPHTHPNETRALEAELQRAKVVPTDAVPSDVITMNSRAELQDVDTGHRSEFTLVFPRDANASEGKISVLAPVGTGMLGYRVGDSFECPVPSGKRRFKVISVAFQPEAALASA